MTAIEPDYDADPERTRAVRVGWQQDVHSPVADRLAAERRTPVLDVGSGRGCLARALDGRGLAWIGVEPSPAQIADCPHRPVVRADATALPHPDESVAAVTCLWMLYHLEQPTVAIAEARRVLRSGGLFVASTSSRRSDPELVPEGYDATTFDAEEAPDIVAGVFGHGRLEVVRWDEPMVVLEDRQAVLDFCRSHLLDPSHADAVTTPLTLTKRGCLVFAVKA